MDGVLKTGARDPICADAENNPALSTEHVRNIAHGCNSVIAKPTA